MWLCNSNKVPVLARFFYGQYEAVFTSKLPHIRVSVVTDIGHDRKSVGYTGIMVDIHLDQNRNISEVSMTHPQRYELNINTEDAGQGDLVDIVKRTSDQNSSPLLVLVKSQLLNVLLEPTKDIYLLPPQGSRANETKTIE